MTTADVASVRAAWAEAFDALRARSGLPPDGHTEESAAREDRRIRHLLTTDPEGSWVAERAGTVVGGAQALRREGLWVLAHLGVSPGAQGGGLGRNLLEKTLTYGSRDEPGLILSSRDPRAISSYALAGFRLHPTVTARGVVKRAGLGAVENVRKGSANDLERAAMIDRTRRGAAHGPDLQHMLGGGAEMLVVEDRGYVVHAGGRPLVLAAIDADVAGRLLTAALAEAPADAMLEINWVTAEQHWAITIAVAAGLDLQPHGPVMVRGAPGPLAPYLFSGPFG